MTKFGEAAIAAVSEIKNNNVKADKAWENACDKCIESQESSIKACPRTVFLGLCEEGYVDSVPKGSYLVWDDSSLKNKKRAIALRNIIIEKKPPSLPNETNDKLWEMATRATKDKSMPVVNDQGGVGIVKALFNANLLK